METDDGNHDSSTGGDAGVARATATLCNLLTEPVIERRFKSRDSHNFIPSLSAQCPLPQDNGIVFHHTVHPKEDGTFNCLRLGHEIVWADLTWKGEAQSECILSAVNYNCGTMRVATMHGQVLQAMNDHKYRKSAVLQEFDSLMSSKANVHTLRIPLTYWHACNSGAGITLDRHPSDQDVFTPIEISLTWERPPKPKKVVLDVRYTFNALHVSTPPAPPMKRLCRSFLGEHSSGGVVNGITLLKWLVFEGDPGTVKVGPRSDLLSLDLAAILRRMAKRNCLPRPLGREPGEEGEPLIWYKFPKEGMCIEGRHEVRLSFANPVKRWWFCGELLNIAPDKPSKSATLK